MTDKELLELAAKFLELPSGREIQWNGDGMWIYGAGGGYLWNPLLHDGDALRLAVKLRISIDQNDCDCCVWAFPRDGESSPTQEDPNVMTERLHDVGSDLEIQDRAAATRRAVVRAAAKLAGSAPPLTAQ